MVQIVVGLFLVALMILSIVQYADNATSGSQSSLSFKGVGLTQTAQGFTFTAHGKDVLLNDLPVVQNGSAVTFQDLYGNFIVVNGTGGIAPLLQNVSVIVVAFDPNTTQPAIQYVELARLSLYQTLPNVVSAMTWNSTAYPGLPVANCSDANAQVTVIQLLVENESLSSSATVVADGSCLRVTGSPEGVLAAKDYLLLSYEGVIAQ